MKTKLNGKDRIFIPQILPQEGSILEQLTVREIVELVNIKSEEFDEYGIQTNPNGGGIMWDAEKIKLEKEFDLKKPHTELLKQAVENLDKNKKVTQQLLDTMVKIRELR